jgi:hypothetical protein
LAWGTPFFVFDRVDLMDRIDGLDDAKATGWAEIGIGGVSGVDSIVPAANVTGMDVIVDAAWVGPCGNAVVERVWDHAAVDPSGWAGWTATVVGVVWVSGGDCFGVEVNDGVLGSKNLDGRLSAASCERPRSDGNL